MHAYVQTYIHTYLVKIIFQDTLKVGEPIPRGGPAIVEVSIFCVDLSDAGDHRLLPTAVPLKG